MWIDLDGLANMRDVGGIPTTDGGKIIPGRLLRSDNLQTLTTSDVAQLLGLGLSGLIGEGFVGQPGVRLAKLYIPGLSDIPFVGPLLFGQDILVYGALVLTAAVAYVLFGLVVCAGWAPCLVAPRWNWRGKGFGDNSTGWTGKMRPPADEKQFSGLDARAKEIERNLGVR